MEARTTFGGARISKSVVAAFVALFAAFVLGGASGYVVRALSLPIPPTTQALGASRSTEPCPSGSHVVVWYAGRTWGCVSEVPRAGGPGGQIGDAP